MSQDSEIVMRSVIPLYQVTNHTLNHSSLKVRVQEQTVKEVTDGRGVQLL